MQRMVWGKKQPRRPQGANGGVARARKDADLGLHPQHGQFARTEEEFVIVDPGQGQGFRLAIDGENNESITRFHVLPM
jgi:hypothetical protein